MVFHCFLRASGGSQGKTFNLTIKISKYSVSNTMSIELHKILI